STSSLRTWVTTFGDACTTVTGTKLLFSSHTWVMPSLVPMMPLTLRVVGRALERVLAMSSPSELDLDVDVVGEVEPHERVDRLRRRVHDVDEALVRAHLEVLAAVLVLVRRTDDAVDVLLRGQRHRADDRGACARDGVHDLARGTVDHSVVVRLEPDADLLSRHGESLFLQIFPAINTLLADACLCRLDVTDPRGR